MARKAITTTITGLKCDNPKCDWRDMSIPFEDYINWVNKPCPCCGENVLTQSDYNRCKLMIGLTNIINTIVKVPADYKGEEDVKMHVDFKDGQLLTKVTPMETFIPNETSAFQAELNTKFNKGNAQWLENALLTARANNQTKNISELDVETLKFLIYGYKFSDDHLAYFFYSTKEKIKEIKKQNNLNGSSIAHMLFESKNNTIYNVDDIYNKCVF